MALKLLQSSYDSSGDSESEDSVHSVFSSWSSPKPKMTATMSMSTSTCFHESYSQQLCDGNASSSSSLKLPLPPVPPSIQKMFGDTIEQEYSISADGKIRSFPHVRGNWSSFVHISLNQCESVTYQVELLQSEMNLENVRSHNINICDDFHVSLSRTQIFRHHWIDSFVDSLREKLHDISRFCLIFDKFEVYVNDEKTRTFIGMKLHPSVELFTLVKACDFCLAEFELEPYYTDPSYHVSLAWLLGDQSEFLNTSVIPILNASWIKLADTDVDLQSCYAESIGLKIGNKLYNFPLR